VRGDSGGHNGSDRSDGSDQSDDATGNAILEPLPIGGTFPILIVYGSFDFVFGWHADFGIVLWTLC
jgi:hypothetical protein